MTPQMLLLLPLINVSLRLLKFEPLVRLEADWRTKIISIPRQIIVYPCNRYQTVENKRVGGKFFWR